jgi:hypothetical protein
MQGQLALLALQGSSEGDRVEAAEAPTPEPEQAASRKHACEKILGAPIGLVKRILPSKAAKTTLAQTT